ncbi:MAG: hypothetical protein PHU80_09130 [Kiritimatiellae bacterium]|nr:hypothetical protein [Kiritimatiellia bacterium]
MSAVARRTLIVIFRAFIVKKHNLVLIAQTPLMHNLKLGVNEDIRSRITCSVNLNRLTPDDIKAFIFEQLDRIRLGHNTFSDEALDLIVRSSEGILRRVRNLCVSALPETVRDRKLTADPVPRPSSAAAALSVSPQRRISANATTPRSRTKIARRAFPRYVTWQIAPSHFIRSFPAMPGNLKQSSDRFNPISYFQG